MEHPVVREYDVPRMLRQSLARPGALADSRVFLGSSSRKRTLSLVGNVDGRDLHRCTSKGFCSTFRDVCFHVTTPALSVCLFTLAMVLTMNARRFQRTHPLRGMEDCSLNKLKDVDVGVIDFARAAVVGSDRSSRDGSSSEGESSDVCCVGENAIVLVLTVVDEMCFF